MNLSSFKQTYSNQPASPWWIKIYTTIPSCTYYFGPFDSEAEAKGLQAGYVDDLLGNMLRASALKLSSVSLEYSLSFEGISIDIIYYLSVKGLAI